jgi:hypothetical protein
VFAAQLHQFALKQLVLLLLHLHLFSQGAQSVLGLTCSGREGERERERERTSVTIFHTCTVSDVNNNNIACINNIIMMTLVLKCRCSLVNNNNIADVIS